MTAILILQERSDADGIGSSVLMHNMGDFQEFVGLGLKEWHLEVKLLNSMFHATYCRAIHNLGARPWASP